MQRYNSFNIIHKGLRAALYQTAVQLQQTDFTEGDQIEDAINKLREVVLLFEGHAYKEDHFVLPLINEYEPSVVATFNAEHQKDEELGVELESAVKKLSETTTSEEKMVAGSELTTSFVRCAAPGTCTAPGPRPTCASSAMPAIPRWSRASRTS